MASEESTGPCHICGEPLDPDNLANCNVCNRRFHLAWSVKVTRQNCGRVWVDEDSMGIGFVCRDCALERGLSL
ncbi:MAG: hypothetical protein V3U90_04335 [Dehalococcoidia bacterium]